MDPEISQKDPGSGGEASKRECMIRVRHVWLGRANACVRVACADQRVLDPKGPFSLLVVFFPFVVGFKIHTLTHIHNHTGQNQ